VAGQGSKSPEDGGDHAVHLEDLDVSDATFARPDLTTFARLDDLGLEVLGQRLETDRAFSGAGLSSPTDVELQRRFPDVPLVLTHIGAEPDTASLEHCTVATDLETIEL
jgi:hypothetical protein